MELQKVHRRITQLQDELLRMKKSRDWYRHRYQWSVSYFLDHDIPMPWGSKRTVRPIIPIALQSQRMKRNHQSNLLSGASSKISLSMQNMLLRPVTFPRNRWLSRLLRTCIPRCATDFSESFYPFLLKLQFGQGIDKVSHKFKRTWPTGERFKK
jgi:hypothetical protein